KGFNTGWCNMAEDDGAYRTYADEICAMAQFYYNEGHLYDNVFTWTESPAAAPYRTDNRWDWWGDTEPSMAPIEEKSAVPGDINDDGAANIADAVLLQKWLLADPDTTLPKWENGDLCQDQRLNVYDLILLKDLISANGEI
ncbi:MAG: dockerin type I repeat-containing protein, partial [Ruminococcus sp.]|nr:dockerin type I repeat-containing protein [Ruminococcus sp.]